jgi:hypothetical protein
MTFRSLFAAVSLALILPLSLLAQDKGEWRAASSNAAAITGDLILSNTQVTIDLTTFNMASIRAITPAEVAAIFDEDVNTAGKGALYRLRVPADRRFLRKNTLCGSEDTQWMATYVAGKVLHVAFFSGDNTPVFTFESISNSSDLCGTFTYVR